MPKEIGRPANLPGALPHGLFKPADLIFIHLAATRPDQLDVAALALAETLRIPFVQSHLVDPVVHDLAWAVQMALLDVVE